MQIKTFLQYDISTNSEQLYLSIDMPYYQGGPVGGRYFARPLIFEQRTREEGATLVVDPFIGPALFEVEDGLTPSAKDFLQVMLDEAWSQGMRPRAFKDHTNELAAVSSHLEDMRALVFKKGKL